MKKHLFVAASSLFVAALAVPASAQINNGGFELPSSTPPAAGEWQYNGGAVRDGTNPHSGSFAANLDNTVAATNVNAQQQTLFGSVTPGTSYTLKYFAQANYGVSGIGQAQVAFMNSTGGILPGYPQFINIPASASYTSYSQAFNAPANSSALFLAFNSVTGAVAGASAHVYVDDVSFAPVPEPTTLAAFGASAMLLKRRRRSV